MRAGWPVGESSPAADEEGARPRTVAERVGHGTCCTLPSSDRDPAPARGPPLKTTLIPIRLERTRETLLELWQSVKHALPILAGVAGPIFVATFALLAWAGVPPMKAATLPWRSGVPLWIVQTVLVAWPLWALRGRVLPEAWCVQLRCLPLTARALWVSDVAVSAAVLAPLGALYVVSVGVFAVKRPAWWLQAMPWPLASLAASWLVSCGLGAAALAWQRRGVAPRASRAARARAPAPEVLLAPRPGASIALLWWPGWRGALTPGLPAMIAGVATASLLALAWTQGPWPVVPGAAWAFLFAALLVTLTERLQRTLESHLAALAPWLAALPLAAAMRWRARGVLAAPMAVAGSVLVALVLATRPWRGWPLGAFVLVLAATPLALAAAPSSNRPAHVGLWAVSTGLLTALGSELWN